MLTHHIDPTDALRVTFPGGEVLNLDVADLLDMVRRYQQLMRLATKAADPTSWYGEVQREARAILAEVGAVEKINGATKAGRT
jgi:hypothetical protein